MPVQVYNLPSGTNHPSHNEVRYYIDNFGKFDYGPAAITFIKGKNWRVLIKSWKIQASYGFCIA